MKVYLLAFILLLAVASCVEFNLKGFKEELNEQGVSNNKDMRKISDALDKAMGWDKNKDDKTRAVIHGIYHTAVGVAKDIKGNNKGAKSEYNRAKEQFNKLKKKSKK